MTAKRDHRGIYLDFTGAEMDELIAIANEFGWSPARLAHEAVMGHVRDYKKGAP